MLIRQRDLRTRRLLRFREVQVEGQVLRRIRCILRKKENESLHHQELNIWRSKSVCTFSTTTLFLNAPLSDSRFSSGTGQPFGTLQPSRDRSTPRRRVPEATSRSPPPRPRTKTSITISSAPPPPLPSPSGPNTRLSTSCVRSDRGKNTRQNLSSSGEGSEEEEEEEGGEVRYADAMCVRSTGG